MPPSPLTHRVQILEGKVGSLERLPAGMDTIELQILQFREEVRAAFSATRDELKQLDAKAVSRDEEPRRVMRMLHEHVVGLIATMGEGGRSREQLSRLRGANTVGPDCITPAVDPKG